MRNSFHLSDEASRMLTISAFKVGQLPDILLEDLVLNFEKRLAKARKIVGVDLKAVDHFLIPLLLQTTYDDDTLAVEFCGIRELFKDIGTIYCLFNPKAIEGKSVEA